MQVILFRHGPAGERDSQKWPDDAVRPLTVRGRERTRLAARGVARLLSKCKPVVWSSPLRRAKQTADLLGEELGGVLVETQAELSSGGSQRVLAQVLAGRKSDECVVLVGHEPDLGSLAGLLLTGSPVPFPLKKAGACAIRFVGPLEPGAGRLSWFLQPKILRRLAVARSPVRE